MRSTPRIRVARGVWFRVRETANGATITGTILPVGADAYPKDYIAGLKAIEEMVIAQFEAGIDVTDPQICQRAGAGAHDGQSVRDDGIPPRACTAGAFGRVTAYGTSSDGWACTGGAGFLVSVCFRRPVCGAEHQPPEARFVVPGVSCGFSATEATRA